MIDLRDLLLQDPWEEIARAFHVPMAPGRRPYRIDQARRALRFMAGIPRQSLERLARGWSIDSNVHGLLEEVHARGHAAVLTLDAPQAILDGLLYRLAGDCGAALDPDERFGRLTGEMTTNGWAGQCGRAVCLDAVARVSRHRYGDPVTLVSDGRPCGCVSTTPIPALTYLSTEGPLRSAWA